MTDTTHRRAFLVGAAALPAALSSFPVLAQEDPPGLGPAVNVFIAPSGKPFRAKEGAPYPVDLWFKQADANGDGKIDKAEFLADSEAFFKRLDQNNDGVLSPVEVAFYEQRIAPEILGYRVEVGSGGTGLPLRPSFLWRAQIDQPKPIDPGGGEILPPKSPHVLDESGAGASPFGFFDEPEPVMAADLSFRGLVRKTDYLKLAGIHFDTLDRAGRGYLTPADLPETPMQKRLHHGRRH